MTRDPNAAIRAELRRLHEQATPPPWQFGFECPHIATQPARITLQTRGLPNTAYPTMPAPIVTLRWYGTWPSADRHLIQNMRNALPALLDEIDACQRWILKQTYDRPFCYRCEVLGGAGAGYCRCEIAANE